MCGRFALTVSGSTLCAVFQLGEVPELTPRYNIAPTQQVPAVVEADSGRELTMLRWGLIPHWAKDEKFGYRALNARGETVRTKPAFRSAFKRRRALIPADGFYEWQRVDRKTKVPHLISLRSGEPIAMAGLWESWTHPQTAARIHSCSIVTTRGNDLMKPIHDRRPVLLPESHWDEWLDRSNHDTEALERLLVPAPSSQLVVRRVSTFVSNARHEGPDCQAPYEGDTA